MKWFFLLNGLWDLRGFLQASGPLRYLLLLTSVPRLMGVIWDLPFLCALTYFGEGAYWTEERRWEIALLAYGIGFYLL